jgi:pyruvate/2-oxoglutarate/acetoin dehydrogenase E1 component
VNTSKATIAALLNEGLTESMERDDSIYLVGEDLLDPYGGAFGISKGLSTKFPQRVVPTPISEAAMTGVCIGMALKGLRPVLEIMFGDFITLTADQLINVAAKLPRMYGDSVKLPLVVRTAVGGGRGYGPTHSQTLDRLFMGIPGLRIVAPSLFHDAKDLLSSILAQSQSPVIFSEHKLLYPQYPLLETNDSLIVRSLGEYLPTAAITNYRSGDPDVGIVTYGGSSLAVSEVMTQLTEEEINVACAVPSSVKPLPIDDIVTALDGARAILVVEEGTAAHGWSSEVAAALTEKLWGQLATPIVRIGAADTPIPAANALESKILPNADNITEAVAELIRCTQ